MNRLKTPQIHKSDAEYTGSKRRGSLVYEGHHKLLSTAVQRQVMAQSSMKQKLLKSADQENGDYNTDQDVLDENVARKLQRKYLHRIHVLLLIFVH